MAWKPIKAVSARVASFAEEVMSWEMEADPLGMAACGNGMLAVLDTRQELHLIDFDESQYKVVPLLPEWITYSGLGKTSVAMVSVPRTDSLFFYDALKVCTVCPQLLFALD